MDSGFAPKWARPGMTDEIDIAIPYASAARVTPSRTMASISSAE